MIVNTNTIKLTKIFTGIDTRLNTFDCLRGLALICRLGNKANPIFYDLNNMQVARR